MALDWRHDRMEQGMRGELPMVKEGFELRREHIEAIGMALGASRLGGRLGFACGPLGCVCSGDPDCNDMFSSGVCGDGICFEDGSGGVVCVCIRNR
jgi:hypothetical protein